MRELTFKFAPKLRGDKTRCVLLKNLFRGMYQPFVTKKRKQRK